MLDALAQPFTVAILVLVIGCALSMFQSRRRMTHMLIGAGVGLLLLLGYGVPFDFIARILENEYAAVLTADAYRDVHWIVVLGAGHSSSPDIAANSQVGPSALYRIVEGVRLHRAIPEGRILFSGGVTLGVAPDARIAADVASSLGVSPERIRLSLSPRTTAEEMACIREYIGTQRFLLVTTALHMPRAMILANRNGLHAIPAPTDYHTRISTKDGAVRLLPQLSSLWLASATVHELLGIAVLHIQAATGSHLIAPRSSCETTGAQNMPQSN